MSLTIAPETCSRRRPNPGPEQTPEPVLSCAEASARGQALVRLALGLILAVFAVRCLAIACVDSITPDESTHLVHCLHYWMTGDDLGMWQLGAPRLPHAVYALASYASLAASGLLPTGPAETYPEQLAALVLGGSQRLLIPARCVAILSGVGLILLVFQAIRRRSGSPAALAAAFLLAMVPEVIAHSAIAGSDMPFTAAGFLSLLALARYAERPGTGRWVQVGLAIGLAWAMRHTALILLVLAGATHIWVAWRSQRPRRLLAVCELLGLSIWATAAIACLAFGILWAGDGLALLSIQEIGRKVALVHVPQHLGQVELSTLLVPSSLLSILKQIRHQNQGHEAYFLGQLGTHGWPGYFPVAFLLKTPIGLIGLFVLAATRLRGRADFDRVALALLALLWVMLLRNKVNIGLRYALLTYPILMVFTARLFVTRLGGEDGPIHGWREPGRRWALIVPGALACWFVVASLGCGTRCLSSFNELARGPGWLYLADSNLDWGQDFDRLGETVERLGLQDVTTDLLCERRLVTAGALASVIPPRSRMLPDITPPSRRLYDAEGGYIPIYTRYVAVSASKLVGLYSGNDLSWLRTRRVVARAGASIWIFDMDHPAEEALACLP